MKLAPAKVWLRHALVLGAIAAVLGGALAASGVLPLSARSGHWAATEAVLRFGKDRAVATHALAVEAPPDLDDPALILRGAGHFEGGCRPCHGAPGQPIPAVAQAMLPPPTDLRAFADGEPPRQLYWVIHGGLKFTGMPGWPGEGRHDEPWALVAFVARLPGMSPAAYRRLVYVEPTADAPPIVATVCGRCHGMDGMGRTPGAFPRLAGQRAAYLEASLRAYASGDRPSGFMEPVALALGEADLRAAVDHYAGRPGLGSGAEQAMAPAHDSAGHDSGAWDLGSRLVRDGLPADDIPACADCHGPSAHAHNPHYPLLSGQDPRYLAEQLRLFRDGRRGGTRYAHLMRAVVAHALTDAQIAAVSAWYGRR